MTHSMTHLTHIYILGDCNLFLNDPEDDCCGEIEVMIADPRARQKGCATEALKLLMGYCYDTIRISKFIAKIGKHNLKSYSLFKNKVSSIPPSFDSPFDFVF